MPDRILSRITYLALAAVTIALGLWVHLGAKTLGPDARDVLGDALWGAMMAWFVGVIAPRASPLARSGVA